MRLWRSQLGQAISGPVLLIVVAGAIAYYAVEEVKVVVHKVEHGIVSVLHKIRHPHGTPCNIIENGSCE